METLTINIPDKKIALVKQLLKELGVTISTTQKKDKGSANSPNALTASTIEDAHKGIGLGKPITNINDFVKSL
jgi:hypothetical protein